jgi:hypothetical protein
MSKVVLYDKSKSFWKDCPGTTISNIFLGNIPFLSKKKPQLLPIRKELDHTYIPDEEKYIYRERYGTNHFILKKLDQNKASDYILFLEKYFYTSDLNVRKKYPLYYLIENIKNKNIYGTELRNNNTKELVGLSIARNIGALDKYPNIRIALITESCIKPEYRKQGLINILYRRTYKYSVELNNYVHIFQIDSGKVYPFSPVLNSMPIYGRYTINKSHINGIKEISLTSEHIQKIKNYYYKKNPDSFLALSNPLGFELWECKAGLVILRDLFEVDSHGKEGADLIYYELYSKDYTLEQILDSTHFGWFETVISDVKWKAKGITATFASHLDYGVPSARPFIFL